MKIAQRANGTWFTISSVPKCLAFVLMSLLLIACRAAAQGECQERFNSGDYKGMLSCSAFMYVELRDPITVREAKGIVAMPHGGGGIANVIVEFRDGGGKIVATKTDSQGHFRIKHLRDGTYKIKTTLSGFSSVMGTIILDRHTDRTRVISIEMPVGV